MISEQNHQSDHVDSSPICDSRFTNNHRRRPRSKIKNREFLSTAARQIALRTMADWVIRLRLLKVTGVAEVFLLGGDRKQCQVLIDPTALIEYDVTAFIGGVLALVITQQSLTVASLVGFISLGGIAVRNGILPVTHYFHLMKAEGEEFTQEMVLRGSPERLAPVLMTALTAGIGLVPLVDGGQEPGREILYPVATVILGGLVTSTFCEFLFHPGLFWKFSGQDAVRLAKMRDSADESGQAHE